MVLSMARLEHFTPGDSPKVLKPKGKKRHSEGMDIDCGWCSKFTNVV